MRALYVMTMVLTYPICFFVCRQARHRRSAVAFRPPRSPLRPPARPAAPARPFDGRHTARGRLFSSSPVLRRLGVAGVASSLRLSGALTQFPHPTANRPRRPHRAPSGARRAWVVAQAMHAVLFRKDERTDIAKVSRARHLTCVDRVDGRALVRTAAAVARDVSHAAVRVARDESDTART